MPSRERLRALRPICHRQQRFQKIAVRVEAIHDFFGIVRAGQETFVGGERDRQGGFEHAGGVFVFEFAANVVPGERGFQLVTAGAARPAAGIVGEWLFIGQRDDGMKCGVAQKIERQGEGGVFRTVGELGFPGCSRGLGGAPGGE